MRRRQLLGLMAAAGVPMARGDGLRRPLNAPDGQATPVGVQPGTSTGVVVANRVIVSGPAGTIAGVFDYIGTPAAGNPPIAWITNAASDPYGNALPNNSLTGLPPTIGTLNPSNGSWSGLNHGSVEVTDSASAVNGGVIANGAGETLLFSSGTTVSDNPAQLAAISKNANGGSVPGFTFNGNVKVTAGGLAVTGGTTTDTLTVTGASTFDVGPVISDGTNTWAADRSITNPAAISKVNPVAGVDISATLTIPANNASVGTTYCIEVPFSGVWEASGALNLEYDLNGTISNLVPLATGLATAGHNYGGTFRLYLRVLTAGAGGTCRIWADGDATDTSVARAGSTSTDLFGIVSPNPAFNTTISNTLAVAAFFSVSNASQTIVGQGSTFTRTGI